MKNPFKKNIPLIQGRGGGGKQQTTESSSPVEIADTVQSNSTARIIDLVCEGPIDSFWDINASMSAPYAWYSTYFDDVLVLGNFSVESCDSRLGDPIQAPLYGFSSIEMTYNHYKQVKQATPVTISTSSSEIEAVRITLGTDCLKSVDDETGDIGSSGFTFKIYVKCVDTGWTTVIEDSIWEKTNSAWEWDYHVNLVSLGTGPYLIKIQRVTDDADDSYVFNRLYFNAITEIVYEKQTFPNSVVVGWQFSAQYFNSSIPERKYLVKGLKVQIPSNYDPYYRTYDEDTPWDGLFHQEWTQNPAWILYDLLTNSRYGCGILAEKIDKWGLYTIAKYCDELIYNTTYGWQPRYTCNLTIDAREDALKVLLAVASCFDGMLFWSTDGIYFYQDSPVAYTAKTVVPANVIDGTFSYASTALRDMHSVAIVTWNNPELNYAQDIEVYEDKTLIQRFGWKPITLHAYGCTNRWQAYRKAKKIIEDEKSCTEIVSYQAGLDHAFVIPGDVVDISDPVYSSVRLGGRIVAVDAIYDPGYYVITLDQEVTLAPGTTYYLSIVDPVYDTRGDAGSNPNWGKEMGYQTKSGEVYTPAGTYTNISVERAWSTVPAPEKIWILTGEILPRKFRIISKKEVAPMTFEFTGLLYDPDKYARIEQDREFDDARYSLYPTGSIAAPTNLHVEETLYLTAAKTVQTKALFSWTAVKDPRVISYSVFITQFWDGKRIPCGTTTKNSMEIQPLDGSSAYTFTVRAYSAKGNLASPEASITVAISGRSSIPTDVGAFWVRSYDKVATLAWIKVSDLDVEYGGKYKFRYSPLLSGANWANSVDIGTVSGDSNTFSTTLIPGTYLIKAVDSGNRESANAKTISTTFSSLAWQNIISTRTIAAPFILNDDTAGDPAIDGWATTLSPEGYITLRATGLLSEVADNISTILNFVTLDTPLCSSGRTALVSTNFPEFDMGSTGQCRVTIAIDSDVINYGDTDIISKWLKVGDRESWTNGATDNVTIEPTLVVYNSDDGVDSGEIITVGGDFYGDVFRFYIWLRTTDSYTTPRIKGYTIYFDVPDRTQFGYGTSSNSAGTDILFPSPFHTLNWVGVTVTLQTGDYWWIDNKTATGFTLHIKNGSSYVARAYEYTATGWGYFWDFN